MSQHVDELAELYALGTLDEAERATVDAHALECESCAKRIGEAEAVAAALVVPQGDPPSRLDRRVRAAFAPRVSMRSLYAAMAAVLVLALIPSFALVVRERAVQQSDEERAQVVHALVNSHFEHVQFRPLTRDAPHAKAIFARTGAWVDVIADTDRALSLGIVRDGRTSLLGTLEPSAGEAALFLRNPPHGTLVLMDGTRVLAQARLVTP